jgi:hypothetical protein
VQQIDAEPGVPRRLLVEEVLQFGLLLRVEQSSGGPDRPVLGHGDGVVGMEAVGGDRRGVDEAPRANRRGGADGVQGALDVDGADGGTGSRACDQEREVDDHIGTLERLLEAGGIADVAPPVLHLGPAVVGGVERAPGDPNHVSDPWVGLEHREETEAERAGGPATATTRSASMVAGARATVPSPSATCGRRRDGSEPGR